MINCLAIDDEPLALDIIEEFVKKIPFLNLMSKCRSAFAAMEQMQKNEIHLLYLDINMPDITGIQFLGSLQNKPMVIFTTAYEKYAIEGYELDVVDYLLKPIPFDRFLKASNKAYELYNLRNRIVSPIVNTSTPESVNDFLFVRSDYQTIKINFAEIRFIEGLKDYIKIYLDKREKPILTLLSLKAIEEKLPSSDFIRVHRSFIVAISNIQSIRKNKIFIADKEIPIGDIYQENVNKIIKD